MKAYISCPLTEVLGKIKDVEKHLIMLGYDSCYFQRGSDYKDTDVKESEMFVLITQRGEFDFNRSAMTLGCGKELDLAHSLNKKLYMAYWKADKSLNIYPINISRLEEGRVLGMSKSYLQPIPKQLIINNYPIY